MSKICGKILKSERNSNPYTRKIGGPRYACKKPAGHKDDCDYEYMLQVEHARRMRGESDG